MLCSDDGQSRLSVHTMSMNSTCSCVKLSLLIIVTVPLSVCSDQMIDGVCVTTYMFTPVPSMCAYAEGRSIMSVCVCVLWLGHVYVCVFSVCFCVCVCGRERPEDELEVRNRWFQTAAVQTTVTNHPPMPHCVNVCVLFLFVWCKPVEVPVVSSPWHYGSTHLCQPLFFPELIHGYY